jgi:predicted Zn-dependent protease
MSQVQLSDFPSGAWSDGRIAGDLGHAQSTFEQVIAIDPANRTANHRLGLIAMLRRDYPVAVGYLEAAYRQDPGHRGVVKNLGYAYVWAGQYDLAQGVLASIPEAKKELGIYNWWWGTMGRMDLAQNAEHMVQRLAGAD